MNVLSWIWAQRDSEWARSGPVVSMEMCSENLVYKLELEH
jgi:hypothetical protein